MYLLFKTAGEQRQGLVKRVGGYLDYVVGFLDDSVKDIVPINHLNPTIIDSEAVALAWKFAGNYSGYISVRAQTLANDQLDIISSTEADGTKVKYYLSDDDRTNAAAFMKIALRKILDEVYDRRFEQLNLNVSTLEATTWPNQLAEARAFQFNSESPTPTLSALAAARGIPVTEMIAKVLWASDTYNAQVASMLASKQGVEAEIKTCQSINDLNVLIHQRFGYNMPAKQQEDLGYQGGSVYNL
jgi:hypothetical protein